jgi:hypothetical protein
MRAVVCERPGLHRRHVRFADVYGRLQGWLVGTGLGDDVGLTPLASSGDLGVPATAAVTGQDGRQANEHAASA